MANIGNCTQLIRWVKSLILVASSNLVMIPICTIATDYSDDVYYNISLKILNVSISVEFYHQYIPCQHAGRASPTLHAVVSGLFRGIGGCWLVACGAAEQPKHPSSGHQVRTAWCHYNCPLSLKSRHESFPDFSWFQDFLGHKKSWNHHKLCRVFTF